MMIHEKVPYYHKENKILHERGASSYSYGHNFTDAEEAQRERVNSAIEDWLPMQKTRTRLLPTEKEKKGESQNMLLHFLREEERSSTAGEETYGQW